MHSCVFFIESSHITTISIYTLQYTHILLVIYLTADSDRPFAAVYLVSSVT